VKFSHCLGAWQFDKSKLTTSFPSISPAERGLVGRLSVETAYNRAGVVSELGISCRDELSVTNLIVRVERLGGMQSDRFGIRHATW
jgi:hypothetical protein